eukprot:scaffold19773_cov43-Cyclotella_meneghiniana.AAC.4
MSTRGEGSAGRFDSTRAEVIADLEDERFNEQCLQDTDKFEFARVCGKDVPIKLSNIEGLYVDSNDGKAEAGNEITYELLRSLKIIDKGVENRTSLRDLHDMMTRDDNVPFTTKLSKIKVYYLKKPIEDPEEVVILVKSFVSVNKSITDAKRGSNHSNSFDICANIVSEVQHKLTVDTIFVRPNYNDRFQGHAKKVEEFINVYFDKQWNRERMKPLWNYNDGTANWKRDV